MPSDADKLSLWEAMEQCCEPALLEQWNEALRAPLPRPVRGVISRSSIMGDQDPRLPPPQYPAAYVRQQRFQVMSRRKTAWSALSRDFRKRIISKEVELQGLQTKPTLLAKRSPIPASWAGLPTFRVKARTHTIVVEDKEFADVTARRLIIPVDAAAAEMPIGQEVQTRRSAPSDGRGRKPMGQRIETVVRTNWDAIQKYLKGKGREEPIWSELAPFVHKRFPKPLTTTGPKIPQENTIRKRLPEIYKKISDEKNGRF